MGGQEYISNLDLKGLQIVNARAENVASLPTPSVGRFVYLTADAGETVKKGYYYSDGTDWIAVGTVAAEAALDTRLAVVEKATGTGGGSTGGDSLATKITKLEENVSKNTTSISTANSNITKNAEDIAKVKSTADKAASNVTAINTAIGDDDAADTVKGRLKAVESQASTNKDGIASLKTTLGASASEGIQGRVATLETKVGNAAKGETPATGLFKDVADNKKDIEKKANSADVYTKTEVDNAIKTVRDTATANATAIETINKAGYITNATEGLTNYYKKTETYTKTEVNEKISASISGAYVPKGSLTGDELKALGAEGKVEGYVYNVSTPFSVENDGPTYPAGTNVVWVKDATAEAGGYWDPLAGITDLSDYATTAKVTEDIKTAKEGAISDAKAYTDTTVGGYVPTSRTINGKALSADITLGKADVGLDKVENKAPSEFPVSDATQTALDKKLDKLTAGPEQGTYCKVTINSDGQVTAGHAIAADDIPDLTAAKITDFSAKARAAGKKIYSGVEMAVADSWTLIGAKNDIPEFPSAITVYNADGQVVVAAMKYDSTNKQVGYQVGIAGTYTVVVSL